MSKLVDVSTEEISLQIISFHHVVKDSYSHCCNSINEVCHVALKHKSIYPVVSDVAERLLIAPVPSVDCERGFSRQNLERQNLGTGCPQ